MNTKKSFDVNYPVPKRRYFLNQLRQCCSTNVNITNKYAHLKVKPLFPTLVDLIHRSLSVTEVWYRLIASRSILRLFPTIRHRLFERVHELNPALSVVKSLEILEKHRPLAYEVDSSSATTSSFANHTPHTIISNNNSTQQFDGTTLTAVRNFLSLAGKPSTVFKVPKDIKSTPAIKHQTENYWIPAIDNAYGGIDKFLVAFSQTTTGNQAIAKLAARGFLDDVVKEEMLNFADTSIKTWAKSAQNTYDKTAALIVKGTNISNSTYDTQRTLLCLEDSEDAQARAAEREGQYRHKLPKALRGSSLGSTLNNEVVKAGSGWRINWSDKEWINSWIDDLMETPDVEWIKERCSIEKVGTYLIRLYLNYNESERTEVIMQALESSKTLIQQWDNVKNENFWIDLATKQPFRNSPDGPFLLYKWYKLFISPTAKRGLKRIDGIAVPGLPSRDKVELEISSKAIGVWNYGGDYLNAFEWEKTADLMYEHNYYPIGKPLHSTVPVKTKSGKEVITNVQYSWRWIPIQLVLIYLLTLALSHSLLDIDFATKTTVNLEFGVWLDGCTSLAHPIVTMLGFLLWNSNYTRLTQDRWRDALRMFPISISVLPETCDVVHTIISRLREEIQNLKEFVWKGVKWSFTFRILLGDNSIQQKVLGNDGGNGDHRCHQCAANFKNSKGMWSHAQTSSCGLKSLVSVLEHFLSGASEKTGLSAISGLFGKSLEDLKAIDLLDKEWKWVSNFFMGLDPLHNLKGHLYKLIERMRSWTGWDDTLFLSSLSEIVGRRLLSDLNGSKLRLLFTKWRESILPAATNCSSLITRMLMLMCHNLEEIMWIFYLSPELCSRKLKLRLHVLCWLHLYYCRSIFGDRTKGRVKDPEDARFYTGATPPSGSTLLILKEWLNELFKLPSFTNKKLKLCSEVNKSKNWSSFNKNEYWGLYILMRGQLSTEEISKLRTIDQFNKKQKTGVLTVNNVNSADNRIELHVDSSTTTPTTSTTLTTPITTTTTTETAGAKKRKRSEAPKEEKKETIMDLYLHSIVFHMPVMFEKIDFKNTNTERFEGFLAVLKHILRDFSNRDLKTDQPFREVIIRHVFKARKIKETGTVNKTESEITKVFKQHKFTELEILSADHEKREVESLFNVLKGLDYVAGEDWQEAEGKITFHTMTGVEKALDK